MKKPRKEVLEAHVSYQSLQEEESIENSKRRHMMSLVSGDFKFFERLLTIRRVEEPTFISKSSARHR